MGYIRTSRDQLAEVSRELAKFTAHSSMHSVMYHVMEMIIIQVINISYKCKRM